MTTTTINDSVNSFVAFQNQNRGLQGEEVALDANALSGQVPAGENSVIGIAAISSAGQTVTFGSGENAVLFQGSHSTSPSSGGQPDSYSFSVGDTGVVTVHDNNTGLNETLSAVNFLIFNNGVQNADGSYQSIEFIESGADYQAASLYNAALSRLPDLPGLEYYAARLASGEISLLQASADFLASPEFQNHFTAASLPADNGGPNDQAFITQLYQNVLHRTPAASELAYYISDLQGTLPGIAQQSRAQLLINFALSPEDEADTSGWLINSGAGGYTDFNSATIDASAFNTETAGQPLLVTAPSSGSFAVTVQSTASLNAHSFGNGTIDVLGNLDTTVTLANGTAGAAEAIAFSGSGHNTVDISGTAAAPVPGDNIAGGSGSTTINANNVVMAAGESWSGGGGSNNVLNVTGVNDFSAGSITNFQTVTMHSSAQFNLTELQGISSITEASGGVGSLTVKYEQTDGSLQSIDLTGKLSGIKTLVIDGGKSGISVSLGASDLSSLSSFSEVNGATVSTTVAGAEQLYAINSGASYSITDTAANIAAAPATVTAHATSTSVRSGPGVSDFLIACEAAYCESPLAEVSDGTPSTNVLDVDLLNSLKANKITSWKVLDVTYLPQDGFYGAAFLTSAGDLIISYEGTIFKLTSTFGLASLAADKQILGGTLPQTVAADALTFAKAAEAIAQKTVGYDGDAYVTGHSLGGMEAEYVAANAGGTLTVSGGDTFGAPGLPGYVSASTPSATALTNYVDYGDPVGNFASNMSLANNAGSVESIGFAPNSGADHVDVGSVQMVGNSLNGVALRIFAPLPSLALDLNVASLTFVRFHMLTNYATDLGVTLASEPAAGPPSPEDILATLDSALGSQGQQDFAGAHSTGAGEIETPIFVISENANGTTITITQRLSTSVQSEPGTDVIQLDPQTFKVIQETFVSSPSSTSPGKTTIQLLPDVTSSGDSQNFTFAQSANDTLVLENPGAYTGSIAGFVPGTAIDLAAVNATAATIHGDVLTVQTSNGALTLNLASGADYSQDSLQIVSDGNGGSIIKNESPVQIFDGPNGSTTGTGGALSDGSVVAWEQNGSQEQAFIYNHGAISVLNLTAFQATIDPSIVNQVRITIPSPTVTSATAQVVYDANDNGYMTGEAEITVTIDDNGHFANVNANFISHNGSIEYFALPNNAGWVTGVSNNGLVVGDAYIDTPQNGPVGFIYSAGQFITISPSGSSSVSMTGINSSGVAVGNYSDVLNSNYPWHAFIYSNGTYTDINPANSIATYAYAINDSGEVVGTYYDTKNTPHGFSYINGTTTTIDHPGSAITVVEAVNSEGQMAGYSVSASGMQYFAYSGGTFYDIPLPSADGIIIGNPLDPKLHISDSGQVSGTYTDRQAVTHGFTYTISASSTAQNSTTLEDAANSSAEAHSSAYVSPQMLIGQSSQTSWHL